MPAALANACCSAMPTSKTRSGWRSAISFRPTGISMAPVMPTMSGRSSAMSAISWPKTLVQDCASGRSTGSPVSGSMTPTAWNWSASSARAGA